LVFYVVDYTSNITRGVCYGDCGIGVMNVTIRCWKNNQTEVELYHCNITESYNKLEQCPLPNACQEGILTSLYSMNDQSIDN